MTIEPPYGITEDAQRFWDSASDGELVFQRCDDCDFTRWPAAGVCPECLSRSSSWVPVEGSGTLWSNVVYHRAYASDLRGLIPYPVGLVELDCGISLLSRIVGMEPGIDAVGAAVTVQFETIGEHGRVPVFGPRTEPT